MKKLILCFMGIFLTVGVTHAEPTKAEYADRVRAEQLLKNEVVSIKGVSPSDAIALNNQIITSIKQINENQLKKGMSCKEINEFVESSLGKQFDEQGMAPMKFTSLKYQLADCAVQSSWNK